MTAAPSGIDIYPPVFGVKFLDDPTMKDADLSEDITGIEIDETLDAPGMFRISLCEHQKSADQTYKWLDNKNLRPGLKVGLFFGYSQEPKEPHITGRIKAITPSFQSASVPTMSLEGYDFLQDLQKSEVEFAAKDMKYSDVISAIAQKTHLSVSKIEDTKIKFAKVEREKNEKDYALIKRLAEKVGFEYFVRGTELYFRAPKDGTPPAFTFEYGVNIINFTPRLATSVLANEVNVVGWNRKTKEIVSATAGMSDIRTGAGMSDMDRFIEDAQGEKVKIKVEGRVVESNQEAKDLAISELKRRNNGFIQGSLEVAGDTRLQPGITVEVLKVGERFSGRYYITKAKHTLGESGYRTILEMRRCI